MSAMTPMYLSGFRNYAYLIDNHTKENMLRTTTDISVYTCCNAVFKDILNETRAEFLK